MRENFVFYSSFFEAGQKLSDKDRLAFYDAIIEYSLTGEEPQMDGLAEIIFTAVKPVLDAQLKNYKNGKKGGRPKKETSEIKKEKDGFDTNETGVYENKKRGFSENKKGAFEKTESYKDKDIDKEKDKKKENNKKKEKETSSDELQTFVKVWNDYAEKYNLPKVKELTAKRKKKLKARLRENPNFLKDFEEALKQVEYSSFLKGDKSNWKIDFDWIVANDTNYVKVIEGSYKDQTSSVGYDEPIYCL